MIKLTGGKEINIDASKITWGEWRKYFRSAMTMKEEDAFIEKATGLTSKEQNELLRDDMRRIVQEIIRVGQEPLSDPNSQSASTLD